MADLDGRAPEAAWIGALRAMTGDHLVTGLSVREAHGRGEAMGECHPPQAVLYAHSTREVCEAVRLCAHHRVPVIPFGAGSSLEGQLHARAGGLCIDLSPMDAVLAVSAGSLDCHVQAGITREALNAHLRGQGLFFPLDPGANATLGGMAATRASGTNAVRYGTMRDVVMGLTVVNAAGEIVQTGGRARKSSTGYDLTRLYVGSEGTLGVITELRLRVFGIPEAMLAGVCQFADLAGAVGAVTAVLQMGVPIARVELLDALQMEACIRWSKLDGFRPLPTLFVEFHGSAAGTAAQAAAFEEAAAEHGGGPLQTAATAEARSKLWRARHNAYPAARALKPGGEAFVTDACVPIETLADVIGQTQRDARDSGLTCPIVGHVGDGNFHVLVLFDPGEPGERERADALATSIAVRAIAAGGTCSGEHGVGVHKLGFMEREHGRAAVGVMRAIKRALDPHDILNPGKLVPPE